MRKTQELFIHNLKKGRKKRGLTQMQLAEKCNVTVGYISEIEMGRKFPSHTIFDRIASALQIKPYKLLLDVDDLDTRELDRETFLQLFCEKVQTRVSESIRQTVEEFLLTK